MRFLLLTLAVTITAGCTAWRSPVKPQFEPPAAFVEATASTADAAAFPAGEDWWRIFDDPQLDMLIRQALAGNADLAGVEASVAQARASYHAARAALWPSIALTRSATRARPSQESAQPYQVEGGSAATNGLELKPQDHISQSEIALTASYEGAVFGRLRKNRNAARADMTAGEADLGAARLALTSQVAASWYQLLATANQAESARHGAALAQQALELQTARIQNGLGPANSAITLKQASADARAFVGRTEAMKARQMHALAVLCGAPPERFSADLSRPVLPAVPVVAPDLPATVLRRRPDIASAEAQLDAALQRVGAAKAAFWPQIVLTGSYGAQSELLTNLLTHDAQAWSFVRQISLPLLDGGRNRAALESAQSRFDAAAAAYTGQILAALREVNDALSDGRELETQAEAAAQSLSAARWSLHEISDRFTLGMINKSDLLTAQQNVLARERALTGLESERIMATLSLIHALGGGWSNDAS